MPTAQTSPMPPSLTSCPLGFYTGLFKCSVDIGHAYPALSGTEGQGPLLQMSIAGMISVFMGWSDIHRESMA